MQIASLDATIVVAIITLFGTIYIARNNTVVEMNKQLATMLKEMQEQLLEMEVNHQKETSRLEQKIALLTEENTALKKLVEDFRSELLKFRVK